MKSVAIGLTFRSDSRTLDDTEVDGFIETIVAGWKPNSEPS